jgi:hypothetical protein
MQSVSPHTCRGPGQRWEIGGLVVGRPGPGRFALLLVLAQFAPALSCIVGFGLALGWEGQQRLHPQLLSRPQGPARVRVQLTPSRTLGFETSRYS